MNKRKKVAWRKHRVAAAKRLEKKQAAAPTRPATPASR